MGESRDVLIVGASGRAAARSARRAGFTPWVVDLFGDEDLAEIAREHRAIRNYKELPAAIADWPMMPWIATGAIENHPASIERLSKERPFWGNPAEVMRKVRTPRFLAQTLKESGCPFLEVRPKDNPPLADGRWMLKPFHSAGGQGIFVWDKETAAREAALLTLNRPHYFQERAEGEAVSAVFLSNQKCTEFVGVSHLLPAIHPATPFAYGGMIGPVKLPGEIENQIARIGQVVGQTFRLRGLWGMDFVQDGHQAWATEVNPRYTASVEIYEYAHNAGLLSAHQAAFESPKRDSGIRLQSPACSLKPKIVGKVVIYANPPHPNPLPQGERGQECDIAKDSWSNELFVPSWGNWATRRDAFLPEMPCLADRPRAGSRIPLGFPICSVLAAADSENACRRELNAKLVEFGDHFRRAGWELSMPVLD